MRLKQSKHYENFAEDVDWTGVGLFLVREVGEKVEVDQEEEDANDDGDYDEESLHV